MEEVIFMHNNELYHFGVKGMKWGVRKDKRYTTATEQYVNTRQQMLKDHERLSDKQRASNRRMVDYSMEKARKEKAKFIQDPEGYFKEDWQDYSRDLYSRDNTYKKLYDTYKKDTKELLDHMSYMREYEKKGRTYTEEYMQASANERMKNLKQTTAVAIGMSVVGGIMVALMSKN